jgi:hypothetical protein
VRTFLIKKIRMLELCALCTMNWLLGSDSGCVFGLRFCAIQSCIYYVYLYDACCDKVTANAVL